MRITDVSFIVVAALAACGDDGTDPPNPDEDACLHLELGPFQSYVASPERGSTAPELDDDGVAYRVTGPGFVFFGAAEAGDYAFYLSADVPLEITDDVGAVVEPESTTTSPACDLIGARHVAALDVGVHYLELTSTGEVTIVVEPF